MFDIFFGMALGFAGPGGSSHNDPGYKQNKMDDLTPYHRSISSQFFREMLFAQEDISQEKLFHQAVLLQSLIEARRVAAVEEKEVDSALIAWFAGIDNSANKYNADQLTLICLNRIRPVKDYDNFIRALGSKYPTTQENAKNILEQYLLWLKTETLSAYHLQYTTRGENITEKVKMYARWTLAYGVYATAGSAVYAGIVYGVAEWLFDGLGASYMEAFEIAVAVTFPAFFIGGAALSAVLYDDTRAITMPYDLYTTKETGFKDTHPGEATEQSFLSSYKASLQGVHKKAEYITSTQEAHKTAALAVVESAAKTLLIVNDSDRMAHLRDQDENRDERTRLIN